MRKKIKVVLRLSMVVAVHLAGKARLAAGHP
jgi:hypothetical protein